MKEKKTTKIDQNHLQSLVHTGAGYDLLRYYTLPDLLGKEAPFILYCMGKNLARKTEISSQEDILEFFQHFGWGKLSIIQEKKHETIFELSGHVIEKRLQNPLFEVDYRMEAGFLAESMKIVKDVECECMEELHKKKYTVTFSVIQT
ncbi:YslB family protein [Thalassobacillus pellis]|uniref:YslB family protein n=1 Tax=Thalassobacillus pellis TaxID=748008 RepID=UPI0019608063|nr:YslB family protein [Thalassobacillus pellis]MBM7555030.1 putative hydrocarbon binding protein [Thalassobacillus pellis]